MQPDKEENKGQVPEIDDTIPVKPPVPDFDDYWAHKVAEKARGRITAYFGVIALVFSAILTIYGVDGIKKLLEERFVKIVEQKEKEASKRIDAKLRAFEAKLDTEITVVQSRREEFLRNTVLPPQYRDSGINISLDQAIGTIRDQGAEGSTVGFSLTYAIQANVKIKHNVQTLVSPRGLYVLAKKYDEWPGENYEGASLIGGIKAAQKVGIFLEKDWPYSQSSDISGSIKPAYRISGYTELKDISQFANLLQQGNVLPVSIAITEDFSNPTSSGLIVRKNQKELGGHTIAIVSYNSQTRTYKFANMWGPQWGANGFGYIKEDYLRDIFVVGYVIQVVPI
jgi:hypothetical protein